MLHVTLIAGDAPESGPVFRRATTTTTTGRTDGQRRTTDDDGADGRTETDYAPLN